METEPTPEELYEALMEERKRCAAFVVRELAKAKAAGKEFLAEGLEHVLSEVEHPSQEP